MKSHPVHQGKWNLKSQEEIEMNRKMKSLMVMALGLAGCRCGRRSTGNQWNKLLSQRRDCL